MRDLQAISVGFVASGAVANSRVDVPIFREPTEA